MLNVNYQKIITIHNINNMDNELNTDDLLKGEIILEMNNIVDQLKYVVEVIKNNGWQNEQWTINLIDRINKLSVEF